MGLAGSVSGLSYVLHEPVLKFGGEVQWRLMQSHKSAKVWKVLIDLYLCDCKSCCNPSWVSSITSFLVILLCKGDTKECHEDSFE